MSFLNRTALCLMALLGVIAQASAQNPAVSISINANANKHAISPYIYGIAYGTTPLLNDLNCPLNRYGGNNTSRYNWLLNADNRGNDWYYQSIGDASATPGERGDTFFTATKAAGAETMLTIPTVGWVAKLGANRSKLSSFSIAKYGLQTDNDWQWFPDAGNGILKSNGQYVTGNDPNDANVPADSVFQMGWVNHLIAAQGAANSGGLKYYILDNEPSIWFGTHRDVHPIGATMGEVRDKMVDYAKKIKAADPNALIVGPEEWGWSGYLYSGYDQQYGSQHGWAFLPDKVNNGNSFYLPWLLDQMKQNSATAGTRLLDVFSVHYYPQGGEFGNDTSTSMQLLRNRSTRSLWDPTYTDQSWINDQVQLIPLLKTWVNTYYPGTKTAITEYNWGAEGHINGATTQADIFGIFGREGLDMAARWTYPDPSTPTYKAMKMYRNYDGQKSGFGDTSISDTVPNPDNVSSFAALRSTDGALTIMVISKYLSGNTPVTLNLANFNPGATAQVWQLTSANSINRLADVSVSGTTLTATVPAQSVTLFVVPQTSANTAAYQINAGGPAVGTFTADNYFTGGAAYTLSNVIDTSGVTNAAPASTYQTQRADFSSFSYSFPGLTANGSYKVRLHFAEVFWTVAGLRPFDVSINGVQVLSNFDIFTAAGAANKAVVKEFNVSADSSGKIGIVFSSPSSKAPCVCAIEVLSTTPVAPSTPTGLTATAGNAQVALAWNAVSNATTYNLYRSTTSGGEGTTPYKTGLTSAAYTDAGLTNGTTYYYKVSAVNSVGESSQSSEASATPSTSAAPLYQINAGGGAIGTFSADNFFTGGAAYSTSPAIDTSGVTNPAPASAYQTQRADFSSFSYSLPGLTANGSYKVRLHFAEVFWTVAGLRPFDVSINGVQVLSNFDIFTAAGAANKAVVKEFNVTADATGKLDILFSSPSNKAPCVCAIEVLNGP